MQSFVKLVNEGDKPVSLPFRDKNRNNVEETVTLEPGTPKMVPWDVALLFCGDHSIKNSGYHQLRDEAVQNLHLQYGALTLQGTDEDLLPKIKVYDESGTEIPTLLSDPAGDALTVAPSEHSDVDLLQKQIAVLQQEMARLQSKPAPEKLDTEGESVTEQDLPADKPTRARVRR